MSELTARVPIGFRFHPTDEELVGYYLRKKVNGMKIDLDLIREIDLYKMEPWDLQELCKVQGPAHASADSSSLVPLSEACSSVKPSDCYFFSRKDKKYPTGNRANRATAQGFWKATGRDKGISSKVQLRLIGMRKTLVFYQGRAPHGVKTDWIMHEFRLEDGHGKPPREDGGWVVCRVFQKNKNPKLKHQERAVSFEEHQHLDLLPDPSASPEILSAGRFTFPDQQQSRLRYSNNPYTSNSQSVKQEMMHLKEHSSHHLYHHQQYYGGGSSSSSGFPGIPNSMIPSTPTIFGGRPLSVRNARGAEGEYFMNTNRDFHIMENSSSSFHGAFHNDATTTTTTTSSGGGGSEDEPILGGEDDNVDWGALLQQESPDPKSASSIAAAKANTNRDANASADYPKSSKAPTMVMSAASDLVAAAGHVPLQMPMKRPNSDLFSAMDLWKYNPVAQPQ